MIDPPSPKEPMTRWTVLITGASRGIGLQYARAYAALGWRVFAACRRPERSPGLAQLLGEHGDAVTPVTLDVTDEAQIKAAAVLVADQAGRLDVLVNNAGIFAEGEEGLETVDAASMHEVYAVNVVGPVLMCKHFADLLRAGQAARVANLTSGAGLLGARPPQPGSQYSYGATKAALNKVIRNLAADLRRHGVLVVGMAPGFVATDMTAGSPKTPPLTPEQSVAGQIKTLSRLTMDHTGRFFAHDGSECDWVR
jgi:NAD(P)-dependent dehydrogenase (short-subunit alcohol dehydrogenase family)